MLPVFQSMKRLKKWKDNNRIRPEHAYFYPTGDFPPPHREDKQIIASLVKTRIAE